ncbi:MAG: YHS domain-containing (seleno)protein [Candidatus Latescibacterota bacterium]|nr:YHS domain-containing (seleno)protein [Candidatus Latescibacterota bacterium]
MLRWISEHKGKSVGIVVGAVLGLAFIQPLSIHVSPLSWGWHQPVDTADGVALSGYDTVAYHVNGAATMGSPAHHVRWMGSNWHFVNEDHRALFEAQPTKYAPQFGGHCAVAVSAGPTASADLTVWHIEDDKLYVFFDEEPMKDFRARRSEVAQLAEYEWKGAGNP